MSRVLSAVIGVVLLVGLAAWHAARPGMSEAIAIQKVGYLSRQFEVPVYFPHIGSREQASHPPYEQAHC